MRTPHRQFDGKLRNPHTYCPSCGTMWETAEETCGECGLDPVSDDEDEKFYEAAVQEFLEQESKV